MPIRDAQLQMSNALTAVADGTVTDILDLGTTKRGDGEPLFVDVEVQTTYTGTTSVQALLTDSADGITFATILEGPVVVTANALAGVKLLAVSLPKGLKRFIQVAIVIVGGNMTTGKINANIVPRI